MATGNTSTLTTNFNVDPYYDDFNETKNFHRILFQPGAAVQARELTQLQTILQNQIDRFGEHIFVSGTQVLGLEYNFDFDYNYIQLQDTDLAGNPTNVSQYVGKTIDDDGIPGLTAFCGFATDGSVAGAPNLKTIYVKYLSTSTDGTRTTFVSANTINVSDTRTVNTVVATTSNSQTSTFGTAPLGRSTAISFSEGILFAKDHFIRVPAQSIIVAKYDPAGTYRVGYVINETIVKSATDDSLFDPASGFSNYLAPGADRLKLDPVLTAYREDSNPVYDESDTISDDFVEMLYIKNGIVQKSINYTQYSAIRDYMARRTHLINGDFFVDGMNTRLREHLRESGNEGVYLTGSTQKLSLDVESGAAFVKGYDIETDVTQHVDIDKGTTFVTLNEAKISGSYGNYVLITDVVGQIDAADQELVYIYDQPQQAVTNRSYEGTIALNGNRIGSAKTKAVLHESGLPGSNTAQFRLYLYDIDMTDGVGAANNFSVARSIVKTGPAGSFANLYADIVLSDSKAKIYETDRNVSLFKAPANYLRASNPNGNGMDFDFIGETTATFSAGVATLSGSALGTGTTFAYGDGNLTTTQEREFYVSVIGGANATSTFVATANIAAGAIGGTTANLFIESTAAEVLKVNDEIFVGSSRHFVTNVDSSYGASLGRVGIDGASPPTAADGQAVKYIFHAGKVIDMGAATSNVVISSAGGIATLDITADDTLMSNPSADVTAYVLAKYSSNNNTGKTKTVEKNAYTILDLADHPGGNNGPWNLGVGDVYNISEVRLKQGGTFGSATDGTDVTVYFELDDGQKDNFYDHSRLKFKKCASLTLTAADDLLVKLDRFKHSGNPQARGYFSVDSYPTSNVTPLATSKIRWQEIPLYVSPTTGKSYDLRDHIDFRPLVSTTAEPNTNFASAPTLGTNAVANTIVTEDGTIVPTNGLRMIWPNSLAEFDLQYYLSRIDMVSLTPAGVFEVTKGKPAIAPVPPTTPLENMFIAKVNVTPYPSLSDASGRIYDRQDLVSTIESHRTEGFTMQEIGEIESRVDRLEYYTKLSILEMEATNLKFSDANGLDRFKNGVLVDSFIGHNIANVFDNDHTVSIDRDKAEVRPSFLLNNLGLKWNQLESTDVTNRANNAIITIGTANTYSNGTTVTSFNGASSGKVDYQVGNKIYLSNTSGPWTGSIDGDTITGTRFVANGDYITLNYHSVISVQQPCSTSPRNTTGSGNTNNFNFVGTLFITPDMDYWCDSDGKVEIDANFDNALDNWEYVRRPFNTEWNSWQNAWYGKKIHRKKFGLKNRRKKNVEPIGDIEKRTGILKTGLPVERKRKMAGEREIDTNLNPFMRSQIIHVGGYGFKPNTRMYAFFDGANVASYITPIDPPASLTANTILGNKAMRVMRRLATDDLRRAFESANTANEGAELTTNSDGELFCLFRVPNEDNLRFRVGSKILRFTDQPNNVSANTTTSGEIRYTAKGNSLISQESIVATRAPQKALRSIRENRTTVQRPTVDRAIQGDTTDLGYWRNDPSDPFAQSFRIGDTDDSKGKSGSFVTRLDLFFETKDNTRPVTVELRQLDPSGSYVTDKIVPFSQITLDAEEINTSADGSAPTPVYFPTPVYLLRNVYYAFVVKPGDSNPNCNIWVARTGEPDQEKGRTVSKRSDVGKLFVPSSQDRWYAVDSVNVKFDLYTAKFVTGTKGQAKYYNENLEFLTVENGNTFPVVGQTVHGETTITLNANVDSVSVGSSFGNGSVNGTVTFVSADFKTLRLKDVTVGTTAPNTFTVTTGLAPELTTGAVGLYDGSSPVTNMTSNIISVDTPTAKVLRYDNFNAASNSTYLILYDSDADPSSAATKFDVNEQIKVQDNTGNTIIITDVRKVGADALNLSADYLIFEDTSITANAFLRSTANTRNEFAIEENDNTYFSSRRLISSKSLIKDSAEFTFYLDSTNDKVSPALDNGRFNFLAVDYLISANVSNETDPCGGGADARYISRTLTLADGQDAEDLVVKFSAYKPANTDVLVYYKILNKEDRDLFETKPWVQMDQSTLSSVYSSEDDEEDFQEYEFVVPAAKLTGSSNEIQYESSGVTYTGFKHVAIKLVLTAEQNVLPRVPRVRKLMLVCLQI